MPVAPEEPEAHRDLLPADHTAVAARWPATAAGVALAWPRPL